MMSLLHLRGEMMHERHLKITVSSHHFTVTEMTARGRSMCYQFSNRLVHWTLVPERGRMVRKPSKVYAARTDDKCEFRFHINQLKDFTQLLHNNSIDAKLYTVVERPYYEAADIDFQLKEGFTLRDYQVPIVDYFDNLLPRSKFLGMGTGLGKGATTMAGLANQGKRFTVIVKPMYIDKWKDELMEKCTITLEEILIVRGGNQLQALLELAKHDQITEKAIIISNVTYQNWIKLYEKYHFESLDLGYCFFPDQLQECLKSGNRIIDEAHQSWFLNFKFDLYTHVPKSISLTATLVSNDPFISETYKIAHPMSTRYKEVPVTPYINSYAMLFRFNQPDHIRTSEYGCSNYSHNAVERSIMKHIPTLKNYFKVIDYALEIGYLKHTRPKKRCLIFAYSIDMIELIISHLKRKHPRLDIRRYVSGDPLSDIMEADLTVTTLGSAGAALDVPELTNVVLTTSISSIQSNKQSFGRLRDLKGPIPEQNKTEFHYFVMTDIQKSVDYHQQKKELFTKIAKTFREYHTGIVV